MKNRMKNIILHVLMLLRCSQWKYWLRRSVVICEPGASLQIGEGVRLSRCFIRVKAGARLEIGAHTHIVRTRLQVVGHGEAKPSGIGCHCRIEDADIMVERSLVMGDWNIIEQGHACRPVRMWIDGDVTMGERNRLRCFVWCRFGSTLRMGDYNNINEGSEVRCDECMTIGDFNQVSYRCDIWDTNTHNIYLPEKRRALTIGHFPIHGYEYEKPKTKPVHIGNDNWIGKNAALLKGTRIGDRCIVAYGATILNTDIPDGRMVVQKTDIQIYENER